MGLFIGRKEIKDIQYIRRILTILLVPTVLSAPQISGNLEKGFQ